MTPLLPDNDLLRRLLVGQQRERRSAEEARLTEIIEMILDWDVCEEAQAARRDAERQLKSFQGEGREPPLAGDIRQGCHDASREAHRVLCALAAAALPEKLR